MTKNKQPKQKIKLTNLKNEINPSGKVIIWSKERMRREGLKSPDFADALMLGFADYYPEKRRKKPKTAHQRWSDKLEQALPTQDTEWEQYANDFWKVDEYKIGGERDSMVWD